MLPYTTTIQQPMTLSKAPSVRSMKYWQTQTNSATFSLCSSASSIPFITPSISHKRRSTESHQQQTAHPVQRGTRNGQGRKGRPRGGKKIIRFLRYRFPDNSVFPDKPNISSSCEEALSTMLKASPARTNAESMINIKQSRAVNRRWRKEGDLTDIPRAWNEKAVANTGVPVARNFLGSDRYVEDGFYWRINHLSFNYAVPAQWLSKFSIASASTFLTVYNLYCFTGYSCVDPKVGYSSRGISKDENQTPRAKSFTAGLSIRF